MYMETNKLFAKNEKEQETLIQAIRIYCLDLGMEFGTGKCVRLIMKSGKRETTEWMEMLNQESIRLFGEKENYKCSGILEVDTIK